VDQHVQGSVRVSGCHPVKDSERIELKSRQQLFKTRAVRWSEVILAPFILVLQDLNNQRVVRDTYTADVVACSDGDAAESAQQ
jgi:hypothetical protein